jgi:hypothetical protein
MLREGKRVSMDASSQEYEPFAMIRRRNSTQHWGGQWFLWGPPRRLIGRLIEEQEPVIGRGPDSTDPDKRRLF